MSHDCFILQTRYASLHNFLHNFTIQYFYHRPKRSYGKVMFLHLSVILFTGDVSVPACTTGHMTGGLCPGGSLSRVGVSLSGRVSVQGGGLSVWGGSLFGGVSVSICLCLHLGRDPPGQTTPSADTSLGRHPPGRHHALGRHPPPTATAAGGTHPTGMHSCLKRKQNK